MVLRRSFVFLVVVHRSRHFLLPLPPDGLLLRQALCNGTSSRLDGLLRKGRDLGPALGAAPERKRQDTIEEELKMARNLFEPMAGR